MVKLTLEEIEAEHRRRREAHGHYPKRVSTGCGVVREQVSFGKCGACGQGELFAMRSPGSSPLLLMCDDCQSQWHSPEDSKSHQKALSTEIEGLDFATPEDVEEAGWGTAR